MKQIFILMALALLLVGGASAACLGGYSYASASDGSDFIGINTITNESISMTADQIFDSFTYFTPRLNFSHEVYEMVTGQTNGSITSLHWVTIADTYTSVNATFKILNGTTEIHRSNYTITTIDNSTWYITWRDSAYNGTNLIASFNRTFVKNVDDLLLNGTVLNSDYHVLTDYIAQNIALYGDDKTFRVKDDLVGRSINLTNWAVGWDYTERTCISQSALIDQETYDGLSATKNIVYGGLTLISIIIIILVAWGLITVMQGGNADLTTIAIVALSGAIMIMIAFVITWFVFKALSGG